MSTREEAEAAIPALRAHVGEGHEIDVEAPWSDPENFRLAVTHEDPWAVPAEFDGVSTRVRIPAPLNHRPRPPSMDEPEIEWNGGSETRIVSGRPPRRGSHAGDPRHAATVAEAFLAEHGITGHDEKFYDALVDVVLRADSLLVFTGNDDALHVVGTGVAPGPDGKW